MASALQHAAAAVREPVPGEPSAATAAGIMLATVFELAATLLAAGLPPDAYGAAATLMAAFGDLDTQLAQLGQEGYQDG